MSRWESDESSSGAGLSLLEMLEEDLDEAVEGLFAVIEGRAPAGNTREYAQGVAYGLARAVGIIRSPYDPDAGLKAARGAAMLRYKANNPSQEAS